MPKKPQKFTPPRKYAKFFKAECEQFGREVAIYNIGWLMGISLFKRKRITR